MTIAPQKRMTLEQYLTYEDGTDTRYELVDGELVAMGAESTINTIIASFLLSVFLQLGLPPYRLGFKQKIAVAGTYATARDPDLILHTEASFLAIKDRSQACLQLQEPNPMLIVEIASPGNESSDNYQRDYVQKPREYAARGIPEYWIVDASRAWVLVGQLTDETYQFQEFRDDTLIISPTFPTLNLSAAQLLTAGAAAVGWGGRQFEH
jgi:Uma2 family endonuclease